MSLLERLKDARVITQEEIDAMTPKERREHHLCRHDPSSHGTCKRSDCDVCNSTHPGDVAHRLTDIAIVSWSSEDCIAHELEKFRQDLKDKIRQDIKARVSMGDDLEQILDAVLEMVDEDGVTVDDLIRGEKNDQV